MNGITKRLAMAGLLIAVSCSGSNGILTLGQTYTLQGIVAGMGSVTDPVVLGGQAYTVKTYIGTCVLTAAREQRNGGANLGHGRRWRDAADEDRQDP